MFNLCHSINDGQMAWHCADIPFFFHNVEVSPVSNMGEVSEKLEKQMSRAFANLYEQENHMRIHFQSGLHVKLEKRIQ